MATPESTIQCRVKRPYHVASTYLIFNATADEQFQDAKKTPTFFSSIPSLLPVGFHLAAGVDGGVVVDGQAANHTTQSWHIAKEGRVISQGGRDDALECDWNLGEDIFCFWKGESRAIVC